MRKQQLKAFPSRHTQTRSSHGGISFIMIHDPWAFQRAMLQNEFPTHNQHRLLPLPPDLTSPSWRGRCYNCLVVGHDQIDCLIAEWVCGKCCYKGHQARDCKSTVIDKNQQFDPLQPRRNLAEFLMPHKPARTSYSIHTGKRQRYQEGIELNREVVVDAKLLPNHSNHTLQSILMAASKTDHPLPATHVRTTISPSISPGVRSS